MTENCFLKTHPHFPRYIEETIDTIEFLNASRGIVWLIDQFGFGFEPVKNDITGNIEKLTKKYSENTLEYRCLKKILLTEKSRGENFATESLLWLRRALTFMATFLSVFLKKEKEGKPDEKLDSVLSLAYENTLKKHHNFFTRILFGALCCRCPNRARFLEIIGYHEIGCENTFQSLLDNYLSNLQMNLEILAKFCQQHKIEPHH